MTKILIYFIICFNAEAFASTILYVGDSHTVGPFGHKLDQLLRDEGHEVATYGSCGSIASWWKSGKKTVCGFYSRNQNGDKVEQKIHTTPIIDHLLSHIRPEIVILEFGGNYGRIKSDEFVINDIKSFIKKIKSSGASCFYITNPDSRSNRKNIPRLSQLIKKAVGSECPIFESYRFTQYPQIGGDGIHYSFRSNKHLAFEWAKNVFEVFQATYQH